MTDIALHAVWTDQECARASFHGRQKAICPPMDAGGGIDAPNATAKRAPKASA
jgi:hypothetical protein